MILQLCVLATRLKYFRHGQRPKHTCNSQDGVSRRLMLTGKRELAFWPSSEERQWQQRKQSCVLIAKIFLILFLESPCLSTWEHYPSFKNLCNYIIQIHTWEQTVSEGVPGLQENLHPERLYWAFNFNSGGTLVKPHFCSEAKVLCFGMLVLASWWL